MGVQPPNFSWVLPGRLAGLALPRLPAHYQFLLDRGVRHLVSLTERGPPHSDTCPGLTLHRLRIPDFCPPAPEQIDRFVRIVDEANARGEVSGRGGACGGQRGAGRGLRGAGRGRAPRSLQASAGSRAGPGREELAGDWAGTGRGWGGRGLQGVSGGGGTGRSLRGDWAGPGREGLRGTRGAEGAPRGQDEKTGGGAQWRVGPARKQRVL